MFLHIWNQVANNLATHARKNLAFVERGAVPVRVIAEGPAPLPLQEEDSVVVGVFGNDNYITNDRARREVELVRQHLKEARGIEVGFGLSQDGYTWAMVVRPVEQHYQTEAGKAFQKAMLKAILDEAVNAAWQNASTR
jgi:hypothetical protein